MKKEIATKLGYISLDEHNTIVGNLTILRHKDLVSSTKTIATEKAVNIDKILDAIHGTRFVKSTISTPHYDIVSEDLAPPEYAQTEEVYPPVPKYVTLSVRIDINGMRRIHEDLATYHPDELEYFVHDFMRELEQRIKTSMSMGNVF